MGRLTTKKNKINKYIKKNDINNNKHYNEYFKWKVGRPNQGIQKRASGLYSRPPDPYYTHTIHYYNNAHTHTHLL